MKRIKRRSFISQVSRTLTAAVCLPPRLQPLLSVPALQNNPPGNSGSPCWLEVCAPLVIQDRQLGIESEIVLTADNFVGTEGYADGSDTTDYEIYLYDQTGKPAGENGAPRRLNVPAMHTTVIPVADIVGGASFWGGMKLRLKPKTRTPTHASDLFSSAFVRWNTKQSFANVHANPDPLEWQRPDEFFYSMPFPPLREYDCIYSAFNPYPEPSSGLITLYDSLGSKFRELSYELPPRASLLLRLRDAAFIVNLAQAVNPTGHKFNAEGANGGTVALTNKRGSVKNFGYLLIQQPKVRRFSVEHPIHQPPFKPSPAAVPFDSTGRFKARNVLYTPLVFHRHKLGGVTFESRFHLSSGAPIEEALWLSPFITDKKGDVAWQMGPGNTPPPGLPATQLSHDAIRLGGQQSCILDTTALGLANDFSGGLSLAIAPLSNHTLMKVELRVAEWDAAAFTHFRPGLAAARGYQKARHRSGLATDYIATGARLEMNGPRTSRDEIIGVMNIDDKSIPGDPTLEVFTSAGLLTHIQLGTVPAFGCCHYLLSELLSGKINARDLSLRLVDAQATLLMSIVHLDYTRRDIAADHGSDRFSTFNDFTCATKV